ncbi:MULTISPECIES: site-specific integrase [unclassified Lysinibacillus]|uniref:tyrosine-type recombinase/integrase n=1 Tax=unclassified Lysinibacillus TaxID=2636778 RepID=UPI00088D2308|nr:MULTISPECIES: site-specific integrase [unclassified Lysinibacillus]SCY98684.1 Site-specific recombinase XerD [Lysinibacillus sp. SG9]SDB47297.1 Site-specific recombinase XerD [Lysinibacillus sp. TC-37]SFT12062.1 Site-specific recombinase XerD [Lysinibacillus sp. SG55]
MGYVQKISKNKFKLIADLGYRGNRRIRKTKNVEAKSEKEAMRLLILFEEEMKQNKDVYFSDIESITLNHLFPRWKDNYAKQHYSARSFHDNCTHLEKRILPIFGDIKLKDIKKVDVVFFVGDLQKKKRRLDGKESELAPSTIHNIYKAFASIMNVAVEWNLIEESPCKNIKLPKLKYEEGKAYSEEQVKLLFERLNNRETAEKRLLVELAVVSAARQGELVALEEKHLNIENNTLLIEQALVNLTGDGIIIKETKGKRKRVVTIPSNILNDLVTLAAVKKYQLEEAGEERVWEGHTFLFSNEFGKPYRPDSISQWWDRFMKKNPDLPRIRFHDLRHTSASLLIHAGEHPKVIQSRLGHSNITTTMNTYGHLLQETDQRASSHFDKLFDEKD